MPLNLRPFPRDALPLGVALEPNSQADAEKLAAVLQDLAAKDPSYKSDIDRESGQAMLHAASDGHIEAAFEIIRNAGVSAAVGAPQVAYREIFAAPVEVDYVHQRQSGGSGQFARVKMRFEPDSRTMSNRFVIEIVGDAIPAAFVPGMEKGFRAAAAIGPLKGYPVVACRATLLDGAFHDVDSSPLAFEIAARAAFREAAAKAGMRLLEPYLQIDIVTPEASAGAIVADFKARRGVCTQKEAGPGAVAIYGFAPLAGLIGYEAHLRAITQGAATYSWKLAGLEEVPGDGGDVPVSPAAAMRA